MFEAELEAASGATGFPVDQLRVLFCLLLAYPMGLVHRQLPGTHAKHLFSIIGGMSFAYFTVGYQIYHSFVTSLVSYIILSVAPRKVGYQIVFVFAMGWLSAAHIYRMITDYGGWTLDATGPQMVLTVKLTSFAFNVYDGAKDDKDVNPRQKAMSVKEMPSLLEYFGYVYWYAGFLAGPSCEFQDYKTFVDRTAFKETKGVVPTSYGAAFRSFMIGTVCGAGIIISGNFPLEWMTTSAFGAAPFLTKLGYMNLAITFSRFRYYFGWGLAEGACTLAGLGYNGVDKNGNYKWDRIQQVNVLGVELGQSFKDLTDGWNMNTSRWLRYYVYERIPGNGFHNIMLTHLTSAFWHGFYPGYYLFFLHMSVAIQTGRLVRRHIRPYVMIDAKTGNYPLKYIYDFLSWVATLNTINFFGVAFLLLSWDNAISIWSGMYFFTHITVFGMFAFLKFTGKSLPRAASVKVVSKSD